MKRKKTPDELKHHLEAEVSSDVVLFELFAGDLGWWRLCKYEVSKKRITLPETRPWRAVALRAIILHLKFR
jgi:hypothetical protein